MKQKTMSELEQEVMNIVWEYKNCSVRQVMEHLSNKKQLAYTTVATLMQRLFEKGFISRNADKSGFTYSPKLSKESYGKTVARSFLSKFINSFGDTAIASFADSIEKLPDAKRKYFIKLLQEHDAT